MEKPEKEVEPVPTFFSCRYLMVYVGFIGFLFIYAMRFNFSIAIVCMVDNSSTSNSNWTIPIYDWDRELQGHILSSFFYGYLLTMLPGGFLADRYGGKLVFFVGMVTSAIATIFIHLGAEEHYGVVAFLRFVTGLGTGVVFPCMQSLWAKWAPLYERTKLIAFTYSGTQVGNVLAYFVSGILCDTPIGWPSIFYLTGGFCLLWCCSWWFGVYNRPEDHPFVKQREVRYIQQHLHKGNSDNSHSIPWRDILTSGPVWAICSAHMAAAWVGYTISVCAPMYMSDVLNFSIRANGLYSAIPQALSFVTGNILSYLADTLRKKGVKTVLVRKGAQLICLVIVVATMIGLGFVDEDQAPWALVIMSVCVMGMSMSRSGYVVNHVDIAPRFAGLLYGFSNSFATIMGIITPIVVGKLTPDKTRAQWQIVFLVCAAASFVGNGLYVILGAGEEQEWARNNVDTDITLEENLHDSTKEERTTEL